MAASQSETTRSPTQAALPEDESAALPEDESASLPEDESAALPEDESAALPEDESAVLEADRPADDSEVATSLDSESNSEIAVPAKRPRPSKTTQRANKKTKQESASSMPPKHPARPETRKPRWSSIQESPIAKVQDSFSRKNRRKLLDLSLNTPVTVAGYNKSARSKRGPSMGGDFSDMFGHFLDRFQAPKVKSKATGRNKAASRRRAGMRHTRRFRAWRAAFQL